MPNPQAPYILLLETSGPTCSVALSKGSEIISSKTIEQNNAHSKLLVPMAKELLDAQNLKTSHLSAVALSKGPGSYTGLRIGASFAKSICYAHDIPLIAISTLRSWANTACTEASFIASMIDARRMDCYLGIYKNDLNAVKEDQFCTINESLIEDLDSFENLVITGTGLSRLSSFPSLKSKILAESALSAESLAILAWEKFESNDFEDLAYFEPNYIKSVHITSSKK